MSEHEAVELTEAERVAAAEMAADFYLSNNQEDRQRIEVAPGPEFFDYLRRTLGSHELTGYYLKDDRLVHVPRVGEEGYVPLEEDDLEADDGPAQIRDVSRDTLRSHLQDRFECGFFEHPAEGPAVWHRKLCPPDAVAMAIAGAQDWASIPRITTTTHTPLVRNDGTLLTQPGYDSRSKTLYLPTRMTPLPLPGEQITQKGLDAAVRNIERLLAEFPFEDARSKAVVVAAMILPLVRLVIPPPYPMFVFNAHQPGSGKTLLAKILQILHDAVMRPQMSSNPEEFRKSVTGVLARTTAPVVVWDNVDTVLRSPLLSGLLTSVEWSDRDLGFSRDLKCRNDRIWVATGNNVQVGGDMPRRTYYASLDPGVENPETRTFEIPNILGYTSWHRGVLLASLLTIVQAWAQRGMPRRQVRSDDYATFAGCMSEILTVFPGLGDALAASGVDQNAVVASADDEELSDFLAALVQHYLITGFTTSEVVARLPGAPALIEALPEELAKKWHQGGSISKSLGKYFARNSKRYAGGLKIQPNESQTVQAVRTWSIYSAPVK